MPLTLLARRLGWADDTRGCEQFLRSVGTVPSRASGSSEAQLDTKAALHTLADCKGSIADLAPLLGGGAGALLGMLGSMPQGLGGRRKTGGW